MIESAVRRFLVARRLKYVRAAAKKIQAFVRKQKCRRAAAKKIQAFVRNCWAERLSCAEANTDEQARTLLLIQDEADAEAQADKIMRALALVDGRLSPAAEETKDYEGEYIMCSISI